MKIEQVEQEIKGLFKDDDIEVFISLYGVNCCDADLAVDKVVGEEVHTQFEVLIRAAPSRDCALRAVKAAAEEIVGRRRND